jgi:hypothetical protein
VRRLDEDAGETDLDPLLQGLSTDQAFGVFDALERTDPRAVADSLQSLVSRALVVTAAAVWLVVLAEWVVGTR